MPTEREIEAAISALMKLNSYLAPHNMRAALEAAERERTKAQFVICTNCRTPMTCNEHCEIDRATHITTEPVTRRG